MNSLLKLCAIIHLINGLLNKKLFGLIAGDGLSEKLGAYSDYRKRLVKPLSRV